MYQLLLVDDEPVIRMTFRNLLPWDDTPWHIAGMVSSGEEALAFVEQHPVDIVITDMKMTPMNGLELIRHLKERRFHGAILVLSTYSDFSLVRQAMQLGARDYMLKTDMEAAPMREALEHLSENLIPSGDRIVSEAGITDDYRRTVLRDLMLGYAPTGETIWNDSILLPHAPYRMLDVVIQGERPATRKSVRNVLLANFSEQADVICLGKQEYICLIPSEKEDEDTLLRRGVQMVRQLKMYLNSKASILVSSSFSDTDAMCIQLEQCRYAAQLFFYEIPENCLTAKQVILSPLTDEASPEKAAGQLAEAFFKAPDCADDWIDALMRRCTKRRVDPEALRNYIFQTLQVLLLNQPQISESAVFASHVDVLSCKSAKQLGSLLHTLLPSLLETTADEIKTGNQDVCELIHYLQQHYTEHISLDTLSAKVNLNRSYLCRLFKRETGESLFQYLARFRLEKAAGLLLQEDLPVREVAARVGIDDPFYFTRMFKKQYGVSPSEYAIQKKAQQTGES